MRHARDPMKGNEPAGRPAHHGGMGQGRGLKDSTDGTSRNRAVMSTPEGRKFVTAGRQVAGQLRRAAECELLATRAALAGRWPEARRLRHEANELRRLARAPRVSELVVDVERELAAVRLARWAGGYA